MLKKTFINLLVAFIVILSCGLAQAVTIATFADPSKNSNNPLFTVDFTNMTLDGNWPDTTGTGLTLQIPYKSHNFANAWFDVNGVVTLSPTIIPGIYSTGPGEINFYADGNSTSPLLVINFDSGLLSPYSFGANEVLFIATTVTFTGSEVSDALSQEQFTFGFANHVPLNGDWDKGYTATASFTSSAVPEPATLLLLGTASIFIFTRKKRSA